MNGNLDISNYLNEAFADWHASDGEDTQLKLAVEDVLDTRLPRAYPPT